MSPVDLDGDRKWVDREGEPGGLGEAAVAGVDGGDREQCVDREESGGLDEVDDRVFDPVLGELGGLGGDDDLDEVEHVVRELGELGELGGDGVLGRDFRFDRGGAAGRRDHGEEGQVEQLVDESELRT